MSLDKRGSLAPYIKDDVEFYDHQIEGVRKLARMRSFLLADEMGLGKSLQALTVFGIDVFLNRADAAIVVCPATLKGNWVEEIERFTSFRYVELGKGYNKSGGPRTLGPAERGKQLEEFRNIKEAKVLVVNYEQVVSHLKELKSMNFDIAIFDEAHYLKNPRARRTKACIDLYTPRSFMLTGSPMLNRVDELWTTLYRIDPSQYPSYWSFRARYCNTPDAPIWMSDGTFKPIGEIQVGDKVMGWTGDDSSDRRRLVESTVEVVNRRIAPEVIEATMESGSKVKCTPDHLWLAGTHNKNYQWINIHPESQYRKGILSKVTNPLPAMTEDQKLAAAYIAGIYDGEGTQNFIAQSMSHNTAIYTRIMDSLRILEIPFTIEKMGIRMRGGRDTTNKMINWIKPVKIDWWLQKRLVTQLNRTSDKVISCNNLGSGEVVSMQTSTGNYVAWGYASKNCVFGGFKNKEIVGVQNEAELTNRLQSVMVRRLKADVLKLKKPYFIKRFVELSALQQKMYDEIVNEMRLTLPHDVSNPMDIENGLTKLLRLKQICGTTATLVEKDESLKLDLAIEDATEIMEDGNKIIVFTQFRGVLSAYSRRIRAAHPDIPVYELHGDVPINARQDVVRSWSNEKGASVIICMIQVAGIGLNMTAARHLQFLDKLFVPKLNQQAVDRAHRIGQSETQTVQVFEYIARDTVEKRIEDILKTKTKLFDDVVETSSWKRMLIEAVLRDE